MRVDVALTACTWIIVFLAAAGIVLAVIFRRPAVKVLGLAVAAMLVLLVVAVRVSISEIDDSRRDALCAGQASAFGIDLTARPGECAAPATS